MSAATTNDETPNEWENAMGDIPSPTRFSSPQTQRRQQEYINRYYQYNRYVAETTLTSTTPLLYGVPNGINPFHYLKPYDEKKLWKEWKKKFHVNSKGKLEKNIEHLKFNLFIKLLDKKEGLRKKVKGKEEEIVLIKKNLREGEKNILKESASIKKWKKELDILKKTSISDLAESVNKQFKEILEIPQVENVNFKENESGESKEIIIRTSPLYVKKEHWDSPRKIGKFLIKFDISLSTNSLRILNTTQRFNEYDHPCIKNTDPCLGNIIDDLEEDKENSNVKDFIIDVISYIESPHEGNGYLRKPGVLGPDYQGWEFFFEKATPVPEGFTFEENNSTQEGMGVFFDETNFTRSSLLSAINTSGASTTTAFISPIRSFPDSYPPLGSCSMDFENRISDALNHIITFQRVDDKNILIERIKNETKSFLFLLKIEHSLDSLGNPLITIAGRNFSNETVSVCVGISMGIIFELTATPIVYFSIPEWYER
jgi:hypothetical protein